MNIGPVLGIPLEEVKQLLDGMASEKAEFALEHTPLFQPLITWLEKTGMGQREWIDSTTLFYEIERACMGLTFPYKNSSGLSKALRNLKTELSGWVEVTGPEKRPKGNNKTFWQVHPGEKLELMPKDQQEDQPE